MSDLGSEVSFDFVKGRVRIFHGVVKQSPDEVVGIGVAHFWAKDLRNPNRVVDERGLREILAPLVFVFDCTKVGGGDEGLDVRE